MEYTEPSPDLEDLEYQTPPTTTILVSAIKEITGMSQIVRFPDGHFRDISTWVDDECINRSFQDMTAGFPRLEEFGPGEPTEVSQ